MSDKSTTTKETTMPQSIRLTNDLRDKIKSALIAKKFDKRIKDLKGAREALAMSVYEEAFTVEDRRKMNRLPAGWMPEATDICARFGSNGDFHQTLANKKTVRVPAEKQNRYSYSYLLSVGDDHPLTKRYVELEAESRAIDTERNALYREIDAVLYSVTTANKLVTAWPEVRETVEALAKNYVTGTTLPAPRVEFLNKALGLTKAA